jgi:hypothetical protein
MRCDECGRPIKNAELWRLGGDPNAPASTSMRQLCWECRARATDPRTPAVVVIPASTGEADEPKEQP